MRLTDWMPHPHSSLRNMRAAFGCVLLAFAACAQAASAGFIGGLSPDERALSGVAGLTAAQAAALDALVSRDVQLALQGGVTAFSSPFSARHSARERADAGLNLLSAKELAVLDMLAAQAIAIGPPPDSPFTYSPPPRPAPAPPETVVSDVSRVQVHGDISLTVGGGTHGRSFYGTSADLFVTDPTGRFTVGVGFEQFRGKGLLSLCDPYGPYGPDYGGPPFLGGW
jgi:hypothetical protein